MINLLYLRSNNLLLSLMQSLSSKSEYVKLESGELSSGMFEKVKAIILTCKLLSWKKKTSHETEHVLTVTHWDYYDARFIMASEKQIIKRWNIT